MKIYLIRHAATAGNLEKRYIGRTDEPLCGEGIASLADKIYPEAQRLYVSPMKRCVQTAQIIYPGQQIYVAEAFRECDFGQFENKNYRELKGLDSYQAWIDSGGKMEFPGGESKDTFAERCVREFERVLLACQKENIDSAALVVHGGTIMSIMEQYACPKKAYYEYQIENGGGYELILEDVDPACRGIYTRSDPGRSGISVSSGPDDRTSHNMDGKNYKKISVRKRDA